MQYIYELIENNEQFPVNAIIVSMDSSAWHWHKEYEFIGILSGSLKIQVQSEEKIMRKGDMILINSREFHTLRNLGNECICMIIQISGEMFFNDESEMEEKELHFYLDSTEDEPPACGFGLLFYRMAKITYETLIERRNSIFRIRAQACSLIADLLDFAIYDVRYKDKDVSGHQQLLKAFIRYLEEHVEEERVLDDACAKFGLSRKTADRICKSNLNISARELRENLRIEKVKKLLKFSSKSMGYIMDVCGYTSENTFYRNFKKSMGLTPKEYRASAEIQADSNKLKGYLDYETPKAEAMLKEIIEKWENVHYK